jgi:hypothetical protein
MLLGVTSNPVVSDATIATSSPAAGTSPAGWLARRGNIAYSPAPTLGTGAVVKIQKSVSTTDTTMADALGLVVEYVPGVASTSEPAFKPAGAFMRGLRLRGTRRSR